MSVIGILRKASPVPLGAAAERKLAVVASRLQSEGAKYNLSALLSDEDIALLHFADCLSLFRAADFRGRKVIDIGSGAGFPALVIAAAEESAAVTALDGTAKKLRFVSETAALAGMRNVRTLCARAEDAAASNRGGFDIAVSRGVARLSVLCELCLPYVKAGGLFVAMKGERGAAEAAEAENALRLLGGALREVLPTPVPERGDAHCLVVVEKTRPTPECYPRAWAKMKAAPL